MLLDRLEGLAGLACGGDPQVPKAEREEVMRYVDMTGKWGRAMELLRQPALADRRAQPVLAPRRPKPYKPNRLLRLAAWALVWFLLGLLVASVQFRAALAGQVDLVQYAHIQPGMSEAEVLVRLGSPGCRS